MTEQSVDKKNQRKIRIIITTILIISCICIAVGIGLKIAQKQGSKANQNFYSEKSKVAIDAISKNIELSKAKIISQNDLKDMCIKPLQEAYGEDVIGLLESKSLDAPYPIVKSDDDEYWLHKTLDASLPSYYGTIFLDKFAAIDFSNYNNTLFGHRMLDGQMFGHLRDFETQESYQQMVDEGKDIFYLTSAQGRRKYKVFAARVIQDTRRDFYITYLDKNWTKEQIDNSLINTGEASNAMKADKILTLSTCTNTDGPTRTIIFLYQTFV